ncbi:acyl-CoA dehydrogenase family protein [Agrococcus jejuensis]|uniref:Acyl-CoA dehydrogenase n=1 Tax=Agrococcus jejuensis TaxID=399736 RepID=A0A1G8E3B6_9MICO|nr:acyl-CoA dehydrogenase family protein [Agrococcus jejuensis]SDH64398.1 Acyl-CoA dehydrogenase [Agrococcus jejuensis]
MTVVGGLVADSIVDRFAPLIEEVRAGAVQRELDRELPIDLVRRLADAGVGRVRLPVADGGLGASIAESVALTIALSAADANVGHLLRSHAGFVELVLRRGPGAERDAWVSRIAGGALVGNATSELTGTTLADISTRVSVGADGAWRLDGRKFYSTGTLYSDWVYLAAADGDARVTFAVPTDAPGVEIRDDWDGFGQRATASGTTVFDGVPVDPDAFATYGAGPLTHIQAFYQLHLVAVLAGIAEAVVRDAGDFVRPRSRSYVHANTARPADDPQVLEVVGRLSTTAFAVRAAVLEAARALDVAAASAAPGAALDARLLEEAEIAVYQAQVLATDAVPDAATRLFEIGGASATERTRALDRHWRNARTVASHNPANFKARTIGAWEVSGTGPLGVWHRYETVGPTAF